MIYKKTTIGRKPYESPDQIMVPVSAGTSFLTESDGTPNPLSIDDITEEELEW